MNNNEKKFSIENFKKNVKQHKAKFVLNCVFIVLTIAMLIFISVVSVSGKNNKSASAYSYADNRAFDYPEFGPKSNSNFDSKSSYNVPYFSPSTKTQDATAFISYKNNSGPKQLVYIYSFNIVLNTKDKYTLRFTGLELNSNKRVNGIELVTFRKVDNQFVCTPHIDGYATILFIPEYNIGNHILFKIFPEIPIYKDFYELGYNEEKKCGYDLGYASGYNQALTDKFTNPINSILEPVSSFLETKLFGGVSIGSMLSVAIFVGLALIFIKMFAGG